MTNNAAVEILVATGNAGKESEFKELLRDLRLHLRFLTHFPRVVRVDETGSTYEENAKLKALGYSTQLGMPSLADDSGLEVDALGGMPGVSSARYGGNKSSYVEKLEQLLAALAQTPPAQRTARFVCCLAFVGSSNQTIRSDEGPERLIKVVRAECRGTIAHAAKGENGFGYDPIFIPDGYNLTFAELSSKLKNTLSHRAKALLQMKGFLNSWISELDPSQDGS